MWDWKREFQSNLLNYKGAQWHKVAGETRDSKLHIGNLWKSDLGTRLKKMARQ